jgi:hypothetical protein
VQILTLFLSVCWSALGGSFKEEERLLTDERINKKKKMGMDEHPIINTDYGP